MNRVAIGLVVISLSFAGCTSSRTQQQRPPTARSQPTSTKVKTPVKREVLQQTETFQKGKTYKMADLPSEWAICEGEFTFSMVKLPNGGLAFNPWGEVSRGNGRLVWKDKNGVLHTFEFSDVDMCSVPGRSGWDSVKPCINVSESERIVLLDANPNNLRDSYKGPIIVLSR